MSRRWAILLGLAILTLLLASLGWPVGASVRTGPRLGPGQETPTVIVEPTAEPRPAYFPRLLRVYDERLPEPVTTRLEGYVVKLTRDGREACAPATHVLQSRPDGFPNAVAHAVLHSPHPEPELNLDLYLGEYVEVFGFSSLAPEACVTLTWQHLRVEALRRVILPPGRLGADPAAR